MSFADALCTVLELAQQNALDPHDPEIVFDDGLSVQAEDRRIAIDTVEDYIVNHLGDE